MSRKFDLIEARKQFFSVRDMLHIMGQTKQIGEKEIDDLVDGAYMNLTEVEQLLVTKLKSCGVDVEELYEIWRKR